eukprot:3526495-Pleurochrysis_carterae.AAC.1
MQHATRPGGPTAARVPSAACDPNPIDQAAAPTTNDVKGDGVHDQSLPNADSNDANDDIHAPVEGLDGRAEAHTRREVRRMKGDVAAPGVADAHGAV